MRTFIAIEIPEEIKKELAEVQAVLKKTGAEASWTRPAGMHLTLKFLGDVEEAKIHEMSAALAQALEGKKRFRLKIAGAGVFPHAQKPRVVWVGIAGDLDALMGLQVLVEEQAVRLGFAQEDRFFKPHLTLGRIKSIGSRELWTKALGELSGLAFPEFDATAISVMKSELKTAGAVYTEVGRMDLRGPR